MIHVYIKLKWIYRYFKIQFKNHIKMIVMIGLYKETIEIGNTFHQHLNWLNNILRNFWDFMRNQKYKEDFELGPRVR